MKVATYWILRFEDTAFCDPFQPLPFMNDSVLQGLVARCHGTLEVPKFTKAIAESIMRTEISNELMMNII
jgi:hypothetical protein